MSDLENPFTSIHDTICFDSKDYSLNHRDAWLYGIIVGWGDSLDGISKKHNWSVEMTERLKRLHVSYQKQIPSQ